MPDNFLYPQFYTISLSFSLLLLLLLLLFFQAMCYITAISVKV